MPRVGRFRFLKGSGEEMKRKFHCVVEVRPGDLDGYEHVHNTVYFSYLEEAWVKMLAELDSPIPRLAERDRMIVITKMELEFSRALKLGDSVEIESSIVEKGWATLTLEQLASCGGKPAFKSRVIFAFLDRSGKLASIPPELEGVE